MSQIDERLKEFDLVVYPRRYDELLPVLKWQPFENLFTVIAKVRGKRTIIYRGADAAEAYRIYKNNKQN